MQLRRPRQPWTGPLLGALGCTSACSFVYDANVFVKAADAQPEPDAQGPAPDVDISQLALDDTDPATVFEGAGCIPEGMGCAADSRGVPIVIRGSSIAPNATVTIAGAGFDQPVEVDVKVAADATLAAFALSIPVMPSLADGMTDTIAITVTQGAVTDSVTLVVHGLDEFQASVDASSGTLDTSTIKARYSSVTIDAPIQLTGSMPARWVATASLTLTAALRGNGAAATGTAGAAPGPGGCAGGGQEAPGDCLGGGGRAGGASSGGGGGGHSTTGSQGAAGGGAGGAATGTAELVPLAAEGGDGGGGGGPGALAGAGGGGGGGGGIIELTSLGALEFGSDATVSANGGAGHAGGGSCVVLDQHGGGGGGGAGGAVLVRAALRLTDGGTTQRVSVAAGAKGAAACNAGGDGAAGRIRVDLPSADIEPAFAGPALYRGPMLMPAIPAVVTTAELPAAVFGAVDATYYLQRNGADREAVTIGSNRQATRTVSLVPGVNRVCAVVRMDVGLSSSEGTNCLDVAYIP
jgi:hypothetical protein